MQTLRVYPNPWAAFDKNGVPCAVCPRDPDADAGGPGQFVGARIDRKNTRVLQDFVAAYTLKFGAALAAKLADQDHRSPIQATFYEYLGVASSDVELAEKLAGKEPIEIPATKYYKDRVRDGSLIPADKATADKVGLPVYVPPADYFATRTLKVAGPAVDPSGPPDLEPTPGMVGLPESPDANGVVLEAPALPEGETREAIDAPADGTTTTLPETEPALEVAAVKPSKSKRSQESNS